MTMMNDDDGELHLFQKNLFLKQLTINKSPSSQGPRNLGGKVGSSREKTKFSGDGLGQAAGSCPPRC